MTKPRIKITRDTLSGPAALTTIYRAEVDLDGTKHEFAERVTTPFKGNIPAYVVQQIFHRDAERYTLRYLQRKIAARARG